VLEWQKWKMHVGRCSSCPDDQHLLIRESIHSFQPSRGDCALDHHIQR
jgi:hypothetical protein